MQKLEVYKKVPGTLRVTQLKSSAGRVKNQSASLYGLGLFKIGQAVVVHDTPAVRGMIKVVQHLVRVEE